MRDQHRSKEAVEYRKLYKEWTLARRIFRDANPFCRFCLEEGRHSEGEVVDHIIPHRGDRALFFDQANWQVLCKVCHDSTKRQIELHGYHERRGADGMPLDPNHPFMKRRRSAPNAK